MKLHFRFEFASTCSYPAAMRVEARAAQHGLAVSWCAFLLGPILREQGWNDSPFNLQPAMGRYSPGSTTCASPTNELLLRFRRGAD